MRNGFTMRFRPEIADFVQAQASAGNRSVTNFVDEAHQTAATGRPKVDVVHPTLRVLRAVSATRRIGGFAGAGAGAAEVGDFQRRRAEQHERGDGERGAVGEQAGEQAAAGADEELQRA